MNRKLAIFGFAIIWVVALSAILLILLPKYSTSVDTNIQASTVNDNNTDVNILLSKDSFFYNKKVFVRHNKANNDSDAEIEKNIIDRKNIFFKPISIKAKPLIKAVEKTIPPKKDNSDFDIKPVPTN
jgi:hypothetical protein